MFRQNPRPSPTLVQSEWWERLASITAETHNSEPPQRVETETSAETSPAGKRARINRKRGFRLNMRRPLFSFLRLNTR